MSEQLALSYEEAQDLTARIKKGVEEVYSLILEAHERKAWAKLGFATWELYVKTEFQMSRQRAYQLLDYAMVRGEFVNSSLVSTQVDAIPDEKTARPLAKLQPGERVETFQRAVEIAHADDKEWPTAKHVEAAVNERIRPVVGGAPKHEDAEPFVISEFIGELREIFDAKLKTCPSGHEKEIADAMRRWASELTTKHIKRSI